MQTGKRWVFDDKKREVLSLPLRTPVVISGVQERFLGFALFRLWPTPCPSGIPLPWEGGRWVTHPVSPSFLWKEVARSAGGWLRSQPLPNQKADPASESANPSSQHQLDGSIVLILAQRRKVNIVDFGSPHKSPSPREEAAGRVRNRETAEQTTDPLIRVMLLS